MTTDKTHRATKEKTRAQRDMAISDKALQFLRKSHAALRGWTAWYRREIAGLEALAIRAYKAGWNDGIHNKGWTDSEVRQRVAALDRSKDSGGAGGANGPEKSGQIELQLGEVIVETIKEVTHGTL